MIMVKRVQKAIRTKKLGRRLISGCLCFVMLFSLFVTCFDAKVQGIGSTGESTSQSVTWVADPSTMDNYIEALNLDKDSRRAGRIWVDKSVFARGDNAGSWDGRNLQLDRNTDGLDAEIALSADGEFLHAFSTLGSSQEYSGKIPSNVVIVIDNSGSMYQNSTTWEETRAAQTISAVNETIDKLMRAHSCNQVAVVLFGNGYEGTPGGDRERKENHDTAVIIVEMGHYAYSSDPEKPYQYLNAAWRNSAEPNKIPANPDDWHTTKDNNGYVYVNEKYINTTGKVAEGGDNYTKAYANGTTNIHAGIYAGFKELLNVKKKSTTFGDIVVEHVPALILLSDGEASDMLSGDWFNPEKDGSLSARIFNNPPGDKNTSYVKSWHSYNGTVWSNWTHTWNMFMELVPDDPKYYRQIFWQPNGANPVVTSMTGYSNDKGVTVTDTSALTELYRGRKEAQSAMLLGSLMTAGYMKAAVQKAYNKECSVYTISMDMYSLEDVNVKAHLDTEGHVVNQDAYEISTSNAVMNPSVAFSTDFLKKAGYLEADGKTVKVYDEYTVGQEFTYAIADAYNDWIAWKNGTKETLNYTYRAWSESSGLYDIMEGYADGGAKYVPIGPDHGNAHVVSPPQEIAIGHLTNDTSTNPYGLRDSDIDVNYVSENGALFASSKDDDDKDNVGEIFKKIVAALNQKTFSPVGGINDFNINDALTYNDPIGEYMEVKDVTNLILFGNNYAVGKTALYDYRLNRKVMQETGADSFIPGWYTEDGVKLEGANANWEHGNFYLDRATALSFVPSLPDVNAALDEKQREKLENTVYTFYRITGKYSEDGKTIIPTVAGESDIIVNPSYGYKDVDGNGQVDDYEKVPENAKVTFDLKSIRIWVEDSEDWVDPDVSNSGMETTTDYDEALHINIPTDALPIQVATMEIDDPFTLKRYTTNIMGEDNKSNPAALPLRLFYSVGVAESVVTSDHSAIDIAKLSTEYLNAHRVSKITLREPDPAVEGDTGGALYHKGYDQEDIGKVEFYSNWYNPANRYTNYVSVNQPNGYTFGDATVTFSPNVENRYYLFQKALPLYALNADEIKEGETPPELDLGSVDVQFDKDGTPLPGSNGKNADYTEFMEKHKRVETVGNGDDQLASDKWYYVVLEYYRSANADDTDIPKNDDNSYKGLMVRTAVPRKGSEFGSGIAGGTETVETASYLAWYYTGETYNGVLLTEDERTSTFYPGGGSTLPRDQYDEYGRPLKKYLDDPTGAEGKWIIAARKGGIRSGDLAQNVIPKSGDWDPEASIYKQNYTYTANNVMLPTISTYTVGDGTGDYDNNVIVNVYLGNNGRMTVEDTTLLVTKSVELGNADVAMTDAQDTYKQFHYQVTIEGFTGVHSAIEIQVNPNSNKWQRRFSTIDILTDNNDMLQSSDAALVSTDEDGNRLYTATEYNYQFGSLPEEPLDPEAASGYYNADGTPFVGKRFYVYCGRNSDAEDAGDSATDHTLRIYSNAENNATLYRGGYTTYVDSKNSSQRPTTNPDSVWYGQVLRPSGDAHLPGVTEFWIRDVYLVPVEEVDGGLWDNPDTKPVYHSNAADSYLGKEPGSYKKLTQYVAATLDPYVEQDEDDSFVSLTSPYLIRGEYLLREINFGIPEEQMYDQSPITVGGKTITAAEAAKNTAQFTLTHNTGLLFRGVKNGAIYRTTEKLSDKLGDGIYTLSRMEHHQHDSFADYRPTDDGSSGYKDTGAQLWEAYSIDRENPEAETHYYNQNGEDVDPKSDLAASALFKFENTENKEGHVYTYSAFGDTSEIEETVRYYNLYNPVPLKIEKMLADGEGLKVEPEDFNREFTFNLKLTGPPGGGEGTGTDPVPLKGSYLFRFYDKMTKEEWNAIGYETLSDEQKAGYDPEHRGRLVREETIPLDQTGTASFRLKGNQYVIIWGLSIGQWYEYSLSENDPVGWDPDIHSEDSSSPGDTTKKTTFQGYLGRSENPDNPVENDNLDITNTKSKPTYELATLLGEKIVEGDAYSMVGNNFSFVIEPFADNPGDDPFHGESRTVTNGPGGTLTFFSEELFPATLSDDVYQYTVREEHRDITGMIFDSSVYLITVQVQKIRQPDGSHIARPMITAAKRAGPREPKEDFPLTHTDSQVTKEGETVNVLTFQKLQFENVYTKNPLTRMLRIQKKVEPFDDRFGDDQFTFRIRFTGADTSAIHWQKFAQDGSLLGNAQVDLDASGEMSFTLRNGDTIEFTNITAGTSYEVEEIGREGFNLQRVEHTVDTGSPNIRHDSSVSATLEDHDQTVVFVNAPGLTLPFSGGRGWTPWYILGALLLTLPPVIYFLYRRRRKRTI